VRVRATWWRQTLVADVPEESGRGVAQRLVRRLLSGVQQAAKLEVKLECLDCLADLLKRFGHAVRRRRRRRDAPIVAAHTS
jgi:hypothetical protein